MTNKEFSAKILKASVTHWQWVLKGERNLGFKKAQMVSQLFNTDITVWIDKTRSLERKAAWKKFNEGEK